VSWGPLVGVRGFELALLELALLEDDVLAHLLSSGRQAKKDESPTMVA
jgi:hypothetical protein